MAWSEVLTPCLSIGSGKPVWKTGILATRQQRLEARSYFSLLPAKSAFILEAKTVPTSAKFIIRDVAQQVGEHTEKLLRSKQGREAHQERKRVGVPYGEEEPPPIFRIAFWIFGHLWCFMGFPGGSEVRNISAGRGHVFYPCIGKIPWRRKWQSTPVFLPGESHGQRSLAGYSPWGRKSRTWLSD